MRQTLPVAILATAFLFSSVPGATMLNEAPRWEFAERLGSVWLLRQGPALPLSDQELCEDIPQLDYEQDTFLPLPQPDEDAERNAKALYEVLRKGQWSIRPLHIWGVYSDVGCKEPLGWGTAFLLGMYKGVSIWGTVEHNVKTGKYFQSLLGREIATNWFVQDSTGNFRELFLVGCKEDKYCILTSSYISATSPLSLDDDVIANSVKVLEPTYVYGCSLVGETVRKYVHYKIRFFCLANVGYINSRERLDYKGGGDVLVSNPAMPGFSGAPVFVYQDDRLLVMGTINAGVSGVFTAVNLLEEDTVRKVKDWLSAGEMLFAMPGDTR